MATIFITGANGFIGRTLAERLRSEGHSVRGVDRQASGGVASGDTTEPGAWAELLTGCDVLIHTAAVVSNAVPASEQWRVNVLGTRRVIEAAGRAGVGRFVHLSSVRAFGDRGFPDDVDEAWPVRPDGHAYVDTKVASEQVVLQAHAADEIDVTVIRPGDVYGPGSRPWTLLPLELVRKGQAVLPANGKGIFSPVFVDDLVSGVLAATWSPAGAGQVFTLPGVVPVTVFEFFNHYARMLGVRAPRCVPTAVAVALAEVAGRAERLRGRESELNAETVHYLARTGGYSRAKAERVLGWVPVVDLDEGMARTEAWLREQGLL